MTHHAHQEMVLFDEAYFSSLLDDIKNAKSSIDFETYIFENDDAGKMLADAFCEAASRGVKIRILVDGVGTPALSKNIFGCMDKVNIVTKVYHPLPWIITHWKYSHDKNGSLWQRLINILSNINARDHRKMCIIDQNIVYIGSANISNHLLDRNGREHVWRETSVKLTGINTEKLQYAFERAYNHIAVKKQLQAAFCKLDPDPVYRLNYSWRLRHIYYKTMLKRIANCKTRIWVANAYFVPDSKLLRKLIAARKKGIDVRILLPSKTDVFIVSLASKTFYSKLLKLGVSIYEYLPSILHEKVLIVDDWYLVGSSNLDYRSLKHDLEVDANLQTRDAQAILEKQFMIDIEHSKKINLGDIAKQSFIQYLLGRIILYVRYWI